MTASARWVRLTARSGQMNRVPKVGRRIGWTTLLVAWIFLCGVGYGQTLHTADGIFFDAATMSISDEGFRFSDAGGEFLSQSPMVDSADANPLLRWGSWEGVRSRAAIWIANGSWLCGNIELVGDSMRVAGKWLEPIEIPLSQIRGIIFQPAAATRDWLEMATAMQSATGTADRVWLENGSGIAGVIQMRPSSDGIVFDVKTNAANRSRRSNGSNVTLEREDVRFLIFSPALLGPIEDEREVVEVGLSDGSLLRCSRLEVSDGNLSFDLGAGLAAQSIDSVSRISKEVRFVRNGRAEVNYLAAMKVAQYRHVAESSELKWKLGINSDVYGHPLLTPSSSNRGLVRAGLAMHAASQVAYRWDQSPGRLLAELEFARLPPGTNPDLGSVRCKVLGAKSGKLVTLYSERLHRNGREEPSRRIVDVDISGTQLIVLVVEEDGQGALGDHVQWLEARIGRE